MPFPEQHQYLTIIGDCYGATERWQFGLRLSDGGVSNQVTAEAVSDDIQRWWQATAPYNTVVDGFGPSSTHRLTEVKCARIQPDGTYPPTDASYSHFYLPPIAGDQTPPAGQLPQGTVCVTLTTAVPRGLASKGRIYLPGSSRYVPQSDGLITSTNANAIAASIKRLINEINANTEVGNVMIYSRGKGVPTYDAQHKRVEYTYPNPGASRPVTGVRVGRVVDTQRRRRRSLAETYQVQTL